jgi:mRNA interferase RelE/StbE
MKIRYTKVALKYLQGLPRNRRERIREAIKGLTETPPFGDIKTMQGYNDGRKRLRVGKFRIVFNYFKEANREATVEILLVMEIGSRGDIYK